MRSAIFVALVLALLSASCAGFGKKQLGEQALTVRYVNLEGIYEFLLNRDREALKVKSELVRLGQQIKGLEQELDAMAGDRQKLQADYRKMRDRMEKLDRQARQYKEKILAAINQAVRTVARDIRADYILNTGDQIIFARKEYDLTEDIIRELSRLEKWHEPASR